jgi:hypothetical protein
MKIFHYFFHRFIFRIRWVPQIIRIPVCVRDNQLTIKHFLFFDNTNSIRNSFGNLNSEVVFLELNRFKRIHHIILYFEWNIRLLSYFKRPWRYIHRVFRLSSGKLFMLTQWVPIYTDCTQSAETVLRFYSRWKSVVGKTWLSCFHRFKTLFVRNNSLKEMIYICDPVSRKGSYA